MRLSVRWQTVKTALAWTVSTAVLVLILLELAGVFGERIEPALAAAPSAGSEGPSAVVQQRQAPVIERYPGTVRSVRRAVVSARILATVRDVLVNPGDRVEAGETLVVLDARDLIARESQAKEALRAAQAELERASADYQRKSALLEDGSISESVYDAAEAAYRAALARVEMARRQLEEAQVALTYAEIKAPFTAIVSERYVDPGDQAAPGVALLKIYDPERLRLEAHVRASRAVRLERGEKVMVRIDALEVELEGKVDEIVPQAESGSRSLLVKVSLPKAERVYPGMFGRLLLVSGERTQILIPREALFEVGQLYFVEVAAPVRGRRLVVPGEAEGQWIEILSGLEAGERVLLGNGGR